MTMTKLINAAQVGEPQANADGSSRWEFRFRMSDTVFAGHFPGRPLLPGIFQPEIARIISEKALGEKLMVSEIAKAKFQKPVLPEETLRVDLKLTNKEKLIQARANFFVNGRAVGETILLLCRRD